MQERNGNSAEITTRDIADKAKIGNDLINYHFQTKEKLITICDDICYADGIFKSYDRRGKLRI